jgi:HD superfamily phosphohydrolase
MKITADSKKRYYNDPIYGIIQFPFPELQQIIDHVYLQRLRRITQCGLSHYVYPGANHTRFHHTLGVAHLMSEAIKSLRSKGVDISDEEYLGACVAALIHDLGHGPYSHALENRIIPMDHERLSILMARQMNQELDGIMESGIDILSYKHPKIFLSQLISSQLDVDRLDYLVRDSFYTGVSEGSIGFQRIIQTLNVSDNRLVVEEKAVSSIEQYLVSRHIMYSQVYMHKTVLALEQMLILLVNRMKYLISEGTEMDLTPALTSLLSANSSNLEYDILIDQYGKLDDFDFMFAIKMGVMHSDRVFAFLCSSILNRKIFRIEWIFSSEKRYLLHSKRQRIQRSLGVNDDESAFLMRSGEESSTSYLHDEEIEILSVDKERKPLSSFCNISFSREMYTRHFICFPRI